MVKSSSHISIIPETEENTSYQNEIPKIKPPRTKQATKKGKKKLVKKKLAKKYSEQKKFESKRKINCQKNLAEDLLAIGEYMQSTVDPYKKRVMTVEDFEIILSSKPQDNWLNDTIINYVQNCLCSQFKLPGLYDTSLGPYLTYPKAQSFYQIMHDANHWILVSTIICQVPCVQVFDSLYHGQLSPSIQKQTAAILCTEVNKIIFSIQCVQQQPNANDCGVFAIAFLVELLFGGDPTKVTFDTRKMRNFLHSSLRVGKFDTPFPNVEEKHEHILKFDLLIEIPVYCVCRMPYFNSDNEKKELQMADCDRCYQWYHKSCVHIPEYVFKRQNKFWFCPKC